MKNSGVCPKCAAADVARVPGETISFAVPRPNLIPAGRLGGVVVTRFLCCACGYSEEWVEAADALRKLRGRYSAAPRSAGPDAGGR